MTSYLWSNFNPKPSCFPKHAASRHFFSINTNPERSSPHETPETTPRRNGLDEFDAEIKEDTLPQGFSERVGMIWLCASIKQRQTRVNSTNIFRYFSVPATWQAVWENEKKNVGQIWDLQVSPYRFYSSTPREWISIPRCCSNAWFLFKTYKFTINLAAKCR